MYIMWFGCHGNNESQVRLRQWRPHAATVAINIRQLLARPGSEDNERGVARERAYRAGVHTDGGQQAGRQDTRQAGRQLGGSNQA